MYVYHENGRIKVVSDKPILLDGDAVEIKTRGISSKKLIRDYKISEGQLVSKNKNIDIKTAKIAFITVWDIPCGIATYSKFLVEEMKNINTNIKIFAEHNDHEEDSSDIVYCWERGKSLRKLIKEIKKYDPDIVYIQHEYGIFPDARYWSSLMGALAQYETYVTLHSVYHHKDKVVCEAVCQNLIVHTDAAKEVLRDKGITSNVYPIPHGCIELSDTSRLWNIYKSPHTLMQFGFGFEYKGWEVALDAVSMLRERYPDIFYIMLFSESEFVAEYHEMQYDKINKLIEDKELEDNVTLIRGYQSDASINNFLRTTKIAIFPYTTHPEHVVYGSSGAARVAMGNHTPIIVSEVPLFYDLEGVVPRINSAEELAIAIDMLFKDEYFYQEIIRREKNFIKENDWRKTAHRYLNVVQNN